MKTKILKWMQSGGAFVLLVLVTGCLLLRSVPLRELRAALQGVRAWPLLVGVGAMGLFLFCEACNARTGLRIMGYRPTLGQCLRYACTGYFYSAITPSASGGQPMQIHAMHRDGIAVAHGTLALLMNLAAFQIAAVGYALFGLLTHLAQLHTAGLGIRLLIGCGVGCNLLLLAAVLSAMFTRKLPGICIGAVTRLLRALHLRCADAFSSRALRALQEYHQGACLLRANPRAAGHVLACGFLQLFAMHCVPYFAALALGQHDAGFGTVFCLQAILFVSVSSLPLPGAVGANEGGFLALYRAVFPAESLPGVMLLSRTAGFYLPVLLTGLALAATHLARRRASRDTAGQPPQAERDSA